MGHPLLSFLMMLLNRLVKIFNQFLQDMLKYVKFHVLSKIK